MGQKINPLGFRLGTTQSHHSFWFAKPKNFSMGIQEDEIIRNCIKDYVKKNNKISSGFEGIAHIGIQKRIDLIQIDLCSMNIHFQSIFELRQSTLHVMS